MKTLIALISLIYASSTYAASSASLKAAFDEFKFVMEVEGAALDPAWGKQTIEALQTRLFDLKNEGISQSEILFAALENFCDTWTQQQIREALSLISIEDLSRAQAQEIIQQIIQNSSDAGLAWYLYLETHEEEDLALRL